MSTDTTKPTIVLVPGAMHVPAHYKTFSDLLTSHGYHTICERLPTCGPTDSAKVGLADDYALIRSIVAPLVESEGKDVVMLMHSMGGKFGSGGIKGLSKVERQSKGEKGGVIGLIYMTAFMLPAGPSVQSMVTAPAPDWQERNFETKLITPEPKGAGLIFYHGLPQPEIDHYASLLQPHGMGMMTDEDTYQAWQDFDYYADRTAFIRTTEDKAVPVFWQDMLVQGAVAAGVRGLTVDNGKIKTVESGHSPFLTNGEETAKYVEDWSNEWVKLS